jgi:hypothetical protein
MEMSWTEWKRTGEKYSQLNTACMTFRKMWRLLHVFNIKRLSVQSRQSFFFLFFYRGGAQKACTPCLDPHLQVNPIVGHLNFLLHDWKREVNHSLIKTP